MTTDSADYCMLVKKWTWVQFWSQSLEIWCMKGMCMLKVASCEEKKLGFSYIIADVSVYDSIVRKLYKYSHIFTDSST